MGFLDLFLALMSKTQELVGESTSPHGSLHLLAATKLYAYQILSSELSPAI